ncbi:MAG: TlpA disulfide reductase family protein [Pseudomonadota bacterium]
MFRILHAALFSLALIMPAAAEDTPFSSDLVTFGSALPATADDTRDDGILRDETGRPVTHPLIGMPLPDFDAPTADGGVFDSAQLEGQWTILVAWGVWCHDSRNDMDNIAAVASRAHDTENLEFVSVHVPWTPDHLDTMYRNYGSVSGYFDARGVSFPTILDETTDLRAALQIQWTPTYLVIGPDLKVRGYRTDLSRSGDGAVDRFLGRVALLRDAG